MRGLLLWRVTGGAYAAARLVQNYYTQFIDMAQTGGMAAVRDSEHFSEVIKANPANRARLMSMQVESFLAVMERWRAAAASTKAPNTRSSGCARLNCARWRCRLASFPATIECIRGCRPRLLIG